ncbi:MarR family transcriptional regulator [Streptomyces sp. NRRL F-5122]|uniref:MarR family winged helix-turn-helix transcriptional regulator n=1 Tax=Streptomyces sp. NRRL F-5122 TaxID=1609098 RepID=UPI000740F473|nr:MarR family transcriptional regulator [Streptomyces sp. NRRL F-5122]KUJ38769.1 MarR family transcriptional regulator [Streptomyces sp. NRRL F-5122]
MADERTPTPLESRLGYLLKHAQLRLTRASAEALAPVGIDGHELAVLVVLAGAEPLSQIEVAARLGVDRTTMVVLIDTLEERGLVRRRRSEHDRRKNIVELTEDGAECLRRGEEVRRTVERRFLAPLDEKTAATLVHALRLLAAEGVDD